MARAAQGGYTVAELLVVFVILAVGWQAGEPRFASVLELARRDQARARLETIFTAERIYWVRHRAFAASLADMAHEGLVDTADVPDGGAGPFAYEISSADDISFEARAVRRNTTSWQGALSVDQRGDVADGVVAASSP